MVQNFLCPPPAVGGVFSGPLTAKEQQKSGTLCHMVGTTHSVRVMHQLTVGSTYACFGLQVDPVDAMVLHIGDNSSVFELDLDTPVRPTLVELCAGVGGIGMGATLAGFKVLCQVDINDLAVEHLLKLRMGAVIQTDITLDTCYQQVFRTCSSRVTTVAAGFNCQPFSYLGDCQGLADTRAASLLGTLRGTYLLQPHSLVLECTPGAGMDFNVKDLLQGFLAVMNWTSQELTFDLCDQWPCRRKRWWLICYPKDCVEVPLVSWKRNPLYACVANLIPEWPIWSPEELEVLSLSPAEQRAYFTDYPDRHRMLDVTGPAPTFLHSYANACTACPCQCRSTPFKSERLERDGLHGTLILDPHGQPRFMHPREVAFLLSFPAGFPIMKSLRATLSMLGQSAAPLQSLWICLHLKQILRQDVTRPFMDFIEDLQNQLRFSKYHLWPLPSLHADRIITMDTSDDIPLTFKCAGMKPVTDLLNAESINLDWGQFVFVLDGCVRVPHAALLRDTGFYGPYRLVRTMKHQITDMLPATIVLALEGGDMDFLQTIFMPSGGFLFEALQKGGVAQCAKVTTTDGSLLRLDARLRNSQTLVLFNFQLVGFGIAPWTLGLHMDFVQMAVEQLHILAGSPAHVYIHGVVWNGSTWVLRFAGHGLFAPHTMDKHIFCCLWEHHWTLCVVSLTDATCVEGHFRLDFLDGFRHRQVPSWIWHLAEQLEDWWFIECTELHIKENLRQCQPHTCGTIMLGHLALELSILHPDLESCIEKFHDTFALLSLMISTDQSLTGWGKPSQQEQLLLHRLETLLKEKGVPADRVEERAHLGLKKIGAKELESALDNQNPWQYLKAVASRPHISFQWLRGDELQSKIQARAASKFQIQHKKPKHGHKKAEQTPLWIDPEQLTLVSGTFFAQDTALPQLSFGEVGPNSMGVAFCTVPDALPFLKAGKQISDKPLGILTTTAIPNDQIGAMLVEQLRFPAQFKGTNEPVLLQGSLLNLGPVPISRGSPSSGCKLDSLPTQTLRLYVYQDQWEGDWDDFQTQPVRSLLQRVPALQLRREQGCGDACLKYHAAVDEPLDNLLLDLWSRSWHRADSKYTKPAEAAYWSVLVRVPASAQLTLQGLSGALGVYVEPRSPSGKEVDDNYGMVWLGDLALQELSHKLKTTQHAIAIFRLRNKYGIRFRVEHLEEGFAALKPSEQFVGTKMQQIYRLYPLPFGTQRASLQKCLTKWGWAARVRQSVGGGDAGTAWEVGASSGPPSSILQLPGMGDVTITLQKSMIKPVEPPALLASVNTKKFLKSNQAASSGSDPWTQPTADPWASYRPVSTPARHTDKFQQIEDRLILPCNQFDKR